MIKRYWKKPVEIEAVQYNPDEEGHIDAESGKDLGEFVVAGLNFSAYTDGLDRPFLLIETLEGNMTARPGDWIIKGVADKFYPCKPEIFAATYEPVTEDA